MPISHFNKKQNQAWRKKNKPKTLNLKQQKQSNFKKFNKKNNILKNIKKYTIIILAILIFFGILFSISTVIWISRSLPDPNQLIKREIAQSTKIFDRTGEELLYEIYGDEKRTIVNLNELPNYIKNATIAVEDKNFYKHKGISFWGIFRGVILQKIRGKRVQGGSTLTQQFVKNSILTSERTVTRKIKEWLLAKKIEKKYTKDEILQMYFNEIPYGSTAYGIEAASQKYFGKNAKDITLAEAAILAALPQAPSKYSPYGQNKDILIGRQHYILDLMVKQEYINQDDADIAKAYEIDFKTNATNIKAPHFVMYVKEILSEKYGEKTIEQGGLKIYTTLDLYKQKIAEEVIEERAKKNEKNYKATNAALISIDPKTGQILAMVGSKDYFNDEIDGQVNITTSKRQPGSSLKPLVYAAAFLKGYTPETILYDVVTNFSNNKDKSYEPHNYDNIEHGAVSIRKALAGSLNIPAVKALYLAGINNVADLAQNFGYTTLKDKNRFGLSLVLGGGEVKMIEHVNAYGIFAREGITHPVSAILKIENANGKIIEEFKQQDKKVIDSIVTRQINDILSDNSARAYAFGESNWLTLGDRPVAAKTGTTNDYRDAWTIGYTPSIVTGVWVGNNDNSKMKRGAAGGTVAAPIWHDYMNKILGDTPVEIFKKPEIKKTGKAVLDGVIGDETIIKIDKLSGLLATEFTPTELIEEQIVSKAHCLLYFVDKDNPIDDVPENPEEDPQFNLWESSVLAWSKTQSSSTLAVASSSIPTEYDNIHIPENKPKLKIISPVNNQIISTTLLSSTVNTSAPRGITFVKYYINDNLFFKTNNRPYNLAKQIDFLNNGYYNLKIVACDDVLNCNSKNIEFKLALKDNNNNLEKLKISIISPSSGLAISNIDFPLSVKFSVNNPKQIAKINLYYKAIESNKSILINTILNIKNQKITTTWQDIPQSETYKIYAEIISWSKKIVKSDDLTITVNNIKNN